ncbi:MAG: serine/threonine-protein kinase [Planctomycetota bacterium]
MHEDHQPASLTGAPRPGGRDSDADAAGHLAGAARIADDDVVRDLRAKLAPHLPAYRIGVPLGRGGMGLVLRARHVALDRDVAIKVLLPPPGDVPSWTERFQREARSLARLSHPGIVTLHDFGQAEGVAWIVMDAVEGSSLRDLLSVGKLSAAEALAIVPQVCAALQYAHENGVVHRDVKPENVLLDLEGRVKLVDFGLAKLSTDESGVRLTRTEQALGTLRYMAPEQLDAPSTVDHRADIFALGVVLYEMLTGQVPQGVFRPPSEEARVDVRLDEVVLRALEREPDRRYQRVSEVRDRVDEIRSDPVGAAEDRHAASAEAPPRMPAAVQRSSGEAHAPNGEEVEAGALIGVGTGIDLIGLVLMLLVCLGVAVSGHRSFPGHPPLGALLGMEYIVLAASFIVTLLMRPMRLRPLAPAVRTLAGFVLLLVVVSWFAWDSTGMDSLVVDSAPNAGLALASGLMALTPFLSAALSARTDRAPRWARDVPEWCRWIGIALCAVGALLASDRWSAGSWLPQLAFAGGAIWLAALLGRSPRTADGERQRAVHLVAGGMAGVTLSSLSIAIGAWPTWMTAPAGSLVEAYESLAPIAYCVSLALGLLGGLLGAGAPGGHD